MKDKPTNPRHKSPKDPNIYPEGWNYERVQKIIKYYDRLNDRPVLKRSRISRANDAVWMEIPEKLVPKVQKLLTEMKKSA
jgi:hypothetical protein